MTHTEYALRPGETIEFIHRACPRCGLDLTQEPHQAGDDQGHAEQVESDATKKTADLLRNQDAFLRGNALAELLVAHGAPADTRLTVIGHNHCDSGYIIYASHNDPEATINALQDSRLPYRIEAGFNEHTRCLLVEGYEGTEIALPAALFPTLQAAA